MFSKELLIVTTGKDVSMKHLISAARSVGIKAQIALYGDVTKPNYNHDIVYFRDPFNQNDYNHDQIKQTVKSIIDSSAQSIFVDNCRHFDDLLIEDKWRQYQLLAEFMPPTEILKGNDKFIDGQHIAKDRLSSRGRGMVFHKKDINSRRSYIIQLILKITSEYRVFGVNGEIIAKAAVRSSKTVQSKVKMLRVDNISTELLEFSRKIYQRLPQLQLVGFDIAVLESGEQILLEINRSPQFSRYNEMMDINLVNKLMKGLL